MPALKAESKTSIKSSTVGTSVQYSRASSSDNVLTISSFFRGSGSWIEPNLDQDRVDLKLLMIGKRLGVIPPIKVAALVMVSGSLPAFAAASANLFKIRSIFCGLVQ